MLRALLLVCFVACPGVLSAGAWPREKGTGFASTSTHLGWSQDVPDVRNSAPSSRYDTLYVEYGLTERWTVGLDLGHSALGEVKAIAFARRPLARPDTRLKIAGELGIGQIDGQAALRPGLSIGMGLERGWLNADLSAAFPTGSGTSETKLDLTYGRNFGRRKAIFQVLTVQSDGGPGAVSIPSSIVTPLWRRIELEVGATYGVIEDTGMGLKLGLWTNF